MTSSMHFKSFWEVSDDYKKGFTEILKIISTSQNKKNSTMNSKDKVSSLSKFEKWLVIVIIL